MARKNKAPHGIKYMCAKVAKCPRQLIADIIDITGFEVDLADHVTLGFGADEVTQDLLDLFAADVGDEFDVRLDEIFVDEDDFGDVVMVASVTIPEHIHKVLAPSRKNRLHLTLRCDRDRKPVESNRILELRECPVYQLTHAPCVIKCRLAAVLRRDDRVVYSYRGLPE